MGCTIKPKLCQSLLTKAFLSENSSIVVDSENEEADIPGFLTGYGATIYILNLDKIIACSIIRTEIIF